jgi:hypothetical protein
MSLFVKLRTATTPAAIALIRCLSESGFAWRDWHGFARQQFSENFAAPQIIGKKTANQRNNYQKFKIEGSLISAL